MSRAMRILVAALAGAVAFSALAARAKAPPKGVTKKAPAKPRPPKKWQTDCFEVKLPARFHPFRRSKTDPKRPWIGAWKFMSAPHGHVKVFFRCSPYRKGPFATVLRANVARLAKKVSRWTKLSEQIVKDGPRNVGVTLGRAWLHALDLKTRAVTTAPHAIARLFRRYPKRNMQVSITVAATGEREEVAQRVLALIADSFGEMDLEEKADLKKLAAKKPAKKPALKAR